MIRNVADAYTPPGGSNPYTDSGIPVPEKFTGPKMLARYHRYGALDQNGDPLGTFPTQNVSANVWFEEGAKDSNMFRFRFVAIARIMHEFADSPTVQQFTPTDLGTPFVSSRWVFSRQDNYNAFTGEGTENHINMSPVSRYQRFDTGTDYLNWLWFAADDEGNPE